MSKKLKILFLCTGNACRSQMAEGWARKLKGNQFDVFSAGTKPAGVSSRAAKVMAEVGVDLSSHTSDHVDQYKDLDFDYVITVCDAAAEACPVFPGKSKVVHHGFPDPPKLAAEATTDEEALDAFRAVRDMIRAYVETLPEVLTP